MPQSHFWLMFISIVGQNLVESDSICKTVSENLEDENLISFGISQEYVVVFSTEQDN